VEKIQQLRQLLAERFPAAARTRSGVVPTGAGPVDEALGGGLPAGLLTELVCAAPSGGGQLVLSLALKAVREERRRAALIDVREGFDPQGLEGQCLRHLVWVRCREVLRALQAAELAIRDGNFALVALDLRGVARAEFRRVPPTAWYRLQRAAEPGEAAVLVMTSEAVVAAAAERLVLERSFPLAAMGEERERLAQELHVTVSRHASHRLELTG
jgi:hypothetical protein